MVFGAGGVVDFAVLFCPLLAGCFLAWIEPLLSESAEVNERIRKATKNDGKDLIRLPVRLRISTGLTLNFKCTSQSEALHALSRKRSTDNRILFIRDFYK